MKSDGTTTADRGRLGRKADRQARPVGLPGRQSTARRSAAFSGVGNIFVGIRPIPGADGQFLYAARGIDPLAAKVAEDAASVSNLFGRFEAHRHSLELGFATVFVMLALTMLFSAIWLGLAWANRLVGPIRRLIRATDEVASGNLHVQVPTRASDGDLGHLGDTFNKMTSELLRQQTRPYRGQRAQR